MAILRLVLMMDHFRLLRIYSINIELDVSRLVWQFWHFKLAQSMEVEVSFFYQNVVGSCFQCLTLEHPYSGCEGSASLAGQSTTRSSGIGLASTGVPCSSRQHSQRVDSLIGLSMMVARVYILPPQLFTSSLASSFHVDCSGIEV